MKRIELTGHRVGTKVFQESDKLEVWQKDDSRKTIPVSEVQVGNLIPWLGRVIAVRVLEPQSEAHE